MKTVVGLFDQFDEARRAVHDLRDAGFSNEDISMIAYDQEGQYSRYLDTNKMGDAEVEDAGDGAAAGAGLGAVLGGLGGLLVGLGALMIPGIGPVIAAGPIITTLAGAGIGAVAGGIVGALVDLGIPDEHANYYAEGVRRGGTLVVLRTDDVRADQAADIMNRYHPIDVERRADMWRQEGSWQSFDPNAGEYNRQGTSYTQQDYNRQHNMSAIPVTGTDDIDDRGGMDDLTDLTHGQDYNRDSGTGMGAGTHRNRDFDRDRDDDNDIPVTGGSSMSGGVGPSGIGSTDYGRSGNVSGLAGSGMSDAPHRMDDDDEDLGVNRGSMSGTSAQDFGRDQGLGMTDSSSRQNFESEERSGFTDRDYNTGVGNQGYNRGTTADDRDMGHSHTSGTEHDRSGFRSSDSDMDDDIPVTGRASDSTYPSTMSGTGTQPVDRDWAYYDAIYRSDYQTRYSNMGQSYAYYQPAYRFGYDLHSDDQYRDWDWDRVEPVARQEWERRGLVGRWEDFKDAVRHAWESVTY